MRRPKYACRACEDVVVQAPAPARLIEGGLPTEATVAQVLVSKYADVCRSIVRRRSTPGSINLDRSTLADWVDRAAWHLRPVHERLHGKLKSSPKLFADETTAPVLDPGRGKTKTGQLWAYARDDRPWEGATRRASPMSMRRIERPSIRSLISQARNRGGVADRRFRSISKS
ncbi:transposase IS66 family protein [Mesorhizobium tianshanense]|uniref:Transposase IS66 family protein n=1 Tax=Mesorhizobium tianshanense TaxID=39844 RepID=A0A562MKG4_9HYPH|nr:transposase IS66 family protein [Mesorhizobium tianshanense]